MSKLMAFTSNNTRKNGGSRHGSDDRPQASLLAELLFAPEPSPQTPPAPGVGIVRDATDICCAAVSALLIDSLLRAWAARADGLLAGAGLQLFLLMLNLGFLRLRSAAARLQPSRYRAGASSCGGGARRPRMHRWRQVCALTASAGASAALLSCLLAPCQVYSLPAASPLAVAGAAVVGVTIVVLSAAQRPDVGGGATPPRRALPAAALLASGFYALAALRADGSALQAKPVQTGFSSHGLSSLRLLPVSFFVLSHRPVSSCGAPTPTSTLAALAAFGLAESLCPVAMPTVVALGAAAAAKLRFLSLARAVAACPPLAAATSAVSVGGVRGVRALSLVAMASAAAVVAAAAGAADPSHGGSAALTAAAPTLGRLAALALQAGWGITYARRALWPSNSD